MQKYIYLQKNKTTKQNKNKANKNKQTNFHQINFIKVSVVNHIICKKSVVTRKRIFEQIGCV